MGGRGDVFRDIYHVIDDVLPLLEDGKGKEKSEYALAGTPFSRFSVCSSPSGRRDGRIRKSPWEEESTTQSLAAFRIKWISRFVVGSSFCGWR